MDESDNNRLLKSQLEHSMKKPADDSASQDESRVDGTVAEGGIVIQGRGAQVNITQYFGTQAPVKANKTPETPEVITVEYYEPETILIPAGAFWMGSENGFNIPSHEMPQHEVTLPVYRIGKYPVTNAQYETFIHETGKQAPISLGWDGQNVPAGLETNPVAGVSWHDALAYCQWLSQKTGRKYTLPNEAQWEKAARAATQNIYPWGNGFDPLRSNHGNEQLVSVEAYPPQSDYGCCDLVGNVRQWTVSLWGEKRIAPDPKFAYPWQDDRRNDLTASRQMRRVVRGCSMKDDPHLLRCSARTGQAPDDVGLPDARHGFRVVMLV